MFSSNRLIGYLRKFSEGPLQNQNFVRVIDKKVADLVEEVTGIHKIIHATEEGGFDKAAVQTTLDWFRSLGEDQLKALPEGDLTINWDRWKTGTGTAPDSAAVEAILRIFPQDSAALIDQDDLRVAASLVFNSTVSQIAPFSGLG